MDNDVAAFRDALDRRDVADIALHEAKPRLALLRIVEVGDVKDADFLDALLTEEADEIDSEKAGTARDENFHDAIIP